jgi:hypothetical protein
VSGTHGSETDDVAGVAQPVSEETAEDQAMEDQEPRLDADATAEPPAEVAELAAACARFVSARYGVELDYQPDTLSLLDQWMRDARDGTSPDPAGAWSRPEDGTSSAPPQTAEIVELVQSAAGAYLGEVIRRELGARWVTGEDHSQWRLCLSTVYCAFNPLGMARESLLLEPAEGWHAHFELDPAERDAIEARLEALPEVPDDEYYAPSTRYDVVTIVFAALRERLRAQGMADVRFTTEDYLS